jgi:hypothetical protein
MRLSLIMVSSVILISQLLNIVCVSDLKRRFTACCAEDVLLFLPDELKLVGYGNREKFRILLAEIFADSLFADSLVQTNREIRLLVSKKSRENSLSTVGLYSRGFDFSFF